MRFGRRQFLIRSTGLAAGLCSNSALAEQHASISEDVKGVLVDLTECVGCRLCEYACKKANDIEAGAMKSYDDQSVFRVKRRPGPMELTVLNSWKPDDGGAPVFAKVNCLHCNHPACVSACIVGALQKQPDGSVTYDAWKCIGCRYCMVACPFQIPAYEYDNVLTPRVRKCEFCSTCTNRGELPACVKECPRQVMTYGKRSELLALAHEKITKHPDKYIDHVYGEHEVGGTSWMYLSRVPFTQAGFLNLGPAAPPALTEAIQHGVFKHWIAPIGWYSVLAFSYWFTGRRAKQAQAQKLATAGGAGGDVLARESPAHEESFAAIESSYDSGGSVATLELSPLAPAAHHVHDDHEHSHPEPVKAKLLTPGVWVLIALVTIGALAGLYRFVFGLAASTNLDQEHPWGLWIAMDVGSGIALAAGGFVTAAVVHIFHREHYHAVTRSALLTALLGYTFYVPGLLADIGRWYNIWHPTIPTMWQANSVLFEVGLCVMIYLNVQYAEIAPIIIKQFSLKQSGRFPRLIKWLQPIHNALEFAMPALLILGVALSTFHQSSLGNLMVITPYKLHHLWWTPWSPMFFLLSAMMVGFPMVIFTILLASWSVGREPEMKVLSPLARYVPVFLSVYLVTKLADLIWRGVWRDLTHLSLQSVAFDAEMIIGVVLPLVLLCMPRVRNSSRWLAASCLMVIGGVVLNRLNVFLIGYHPPYATKSYFPSVVEFCLSIGLLAALLLVYRVAITYLPILDRRPRSSR